MRAIVSLSLLLLSHYIYAQELFDTVKTVEVRAEREIEMGLQRMDSMAIHGSQYHNIGEVLQENANLYIKSYGIGSMSTVSIRGTNSTQSNLLWNGISLNSASNGGLDLSLFPTSFIDDVEVHYGLNSMLYGSGGLGGAISFYNKPNFGDKRVIQLQQKAGSFGLYNTNLRLDFGNDKFKSVSRLFYNRAENNFEYLNYGKYERPREKVKNASLEQQGFLQSFYYRIAENKLLSADIWLYQSDRNLPPLMSSLKFKEGQKDKAIRALFSYTNYYETGQLKIATGLLKDEIDYFNERASTQSLTTTIDWKNYAQLEHKWNEKIATIFRINANYSKLLSKDETATDVDRKVLSAMAQTTYSFHPKWKVIGSLSEEILLEEVDFLFGFLELNYQPLKYQEDLYFYTRAGKNVKYPTLNDLYWRPGGDINLRAEHNYAVEAGVKYDKEWFLSYRGSFDASIYHSKIDNYIQWQPTIYGYWKANNLKAVQLRGVEGRVQLSDEESKLQKKVRANYTYTQSINTEANFQYDASANRQLIYIPEHQFNLMAFLSLKGFYLKYNFNLMGARYITSDNTEYLPYYKLSDLTLGKKFSYKAHDFNLSFSALNLWDVDYQAILHRPMPGRNFLFTLNYYVKP